MSLKFFDRRIGNHKYLSFKVLCEQTKLTKLLGAYIIVAYRVFTKISRGHEVLNLKVFPV